MTDRVRAFLNITYQYAKLMDEYHEAKIVAEQDRGESNWSRSDEAGEFRCNLDETARSAHQILASMLSRPEDEL